MIHRLGVDDAPEVTLAFNDLPDRLRWTELWLRRGHVVRLLNDGEVYVVLVPTSLGHERRLVGQNVRLGCPRELAHRLHLMPEGTPFRSLLVQPAPDALRQYFARELYDLRRAERRERFDHDTSFACLMLMMATDLDYVLNRFARLSLAYAGLRA